MYLNSVITSMYFIVSGGAFAHLRDAQEITFCHIIISLNVPHFRFTSKAHRVAFIVKAAATNAMYLSLQLRLHASKSSAR